MRKKNKLVFGVGVNDADYPVSTEVNINGKRKCIWKCPFYVKWHSMLKRAYSKRYEFENPTYTDCSVCPEWLTFSIFKVWMESQNWEGRALDKDLLNAGNKQYSPECCIFIDQEVNNFILERNASRGAWPIGVHFAKDRDKFIASCQEYGLYGPRKRKYLGQFDTPEEAHKAWLTDKRKKAKMFASKQSDLRVASALIRRYENYESDC